MTEKVVNVKELEKVKGFIDGIKEVIDDIIINKSIPSASNQLTVKIEGSDLSEKDKTLFNYIKNNQGIIKKDVVNFFEKSWLFKGTHFFSNKEIRERIPNDNRKAWERK